jgi:acyl-CoA thioesterase FadM
MNLYFRLLRILLISRWQSAIAKFGKCRTRFRVWPSDLDLLGHMNNGVYLTIMDLARLNLLIRSGLAKKLVSAGFYPVVAAETITFKKSLRAFRAFDIQTQILGWDEKNFYLEQIFLREEEVYARAIIKARLLNKSGKKFTAVECMQAIGESAVSPPLPDYLQNWITASAK